MNVKLAEHFYSIQGEGPTAGHPALFMRFQKCNLHCESDQWVCDTQEQMKKSYDFDLEKDIIQDFSKLKEIERIVFTGGETMLYQKQIYDIMKFLNERDMYPYVEIETNGTQLIKSFMDEIWPIQYNCSPKLSNSGNSKEKRYKLEALKMIAEEPESCFKFVIASQQDKKELLTDFDWLFKDHKDKIWLMPAGYSRNQQWIAAPEVAKLAMELNVKLSLRMQVMLWDTKKGI